MDRDERDGRGGRSRSRSRSRSPRRDRVNARDRFDRDRFDRPSARSEYEFNRDDRDRRQRTDGGENGRGGDQRPTHVSEARFGSANDAKGRAGGADDARVAPKVDPNGEWRCDGCHNSNFSWRKTCKRCNAPKSAKLKEAERQAAAGWLLDGLEDTTNRIFIKGFDPTKTTEDDLRELFCGIGIIARVRQRTGFPDQWPYAVKIYRDERGDKKDEAVITYDDPHAAQSAPGFYDGYDFNGHKLTVEIAKSKPRSEGGASAAPPQSSGGRGYGGGGGYGGGDGGYGGGGRGGYGGGSRGGDFNRSRPY